MNNEKKNINSTEYKSAGMGIPAELENLLVFDATIIDNKYYSDGFAVQAGSRDGLRYGWCNNEDFLNQFIAFANANGSGSIYAIWINNSETPLNQLPVVVFGDEGGVHIVAENILQLLHLLTFDVEIVVDDDKAYFHKDPYKYKKSENLDKYLEWIKENYDLEPISEPEKIIKTAQEKYKEVFDNWFKQYYPN
jgi:hypothetical protein